LSAEKPGFRANETSMGHLTASQYGPRARVEQCYEIVKEKTLAKSRPEEGRAR